MVDILTNVVINKTALIQVFATYLDDYFSIFDLVQTTIPILIQKLSEIKKTIIRFVIIEIKISYFSNRPRTVFTNGQDLNTFFYRF